MDNNEGQMGLTYLTVLQRVLGQKKWDDLVGRLAELSPKTYECMPDMALNIGLGKRLSRLTGNDVLHRVLLRYPEQAR